jgi:hypothetical protein
MPQYPIRPDLLRERAEIARIYAEDMRDPEARRQMLDIASVTVWRLHRRRWRSYGVGDVWTSFIERFVPTGRLPSSPRASLHVPSD